MLFIQYYCMMNKKRFMILAKNLIFLLFFVVLVGIVNAATYNCSNCTDCNNVINSAGSGDVIQLNESISNIDGNCIDFNGTDDITFDCLGNTIDGDGDFNGYGIYLPSANGGTANSTIKNCNVSGFEFGIRGYYSSPGNTFENINLSENTNYGIYTTSSNNSKFQNIRMLGTKNDIGTEASSNNIFENITGDNLTSVSWIKFFDGSDNNTLENITGNTYLYIVSDDNRVYNSVFWRISVGDVSYLPSNNTLENLTVENGAGIDLIYTSNNKLKNIISNSNNEHGIEIEQATGNTLENITVNNNSQYGIYLTSSSNNNLTNITLNNNNDYSIFLKSSSNNNILTNITSNNNYGGIEFHSSSNNNLDNSIFQENTYLDVYIYANQDSYCDNNFTNITGSGGRAIEYYNYSATIQDKVLSGLILCNADNSTVNNVTIKGSDTLQNNGIWLIRVDNVSVSDVNSSGNYYGIRFEFSSNNNTLANITVNNNSYGVGFYSSNNNNTLINITANSNSYQGINLDSDSNNNTLTNITTNSNTQDGIIIQSSSNTLQNIISNSNNRGIYLSSSSNNSLTNITANSNNYGILIQYSSNNILKNSNMSNNNYDFRIEGNSNANHNNDIDTSNIVDYSYKIYYNYSISNYVFDLTTAPEAGTIICAVCDNVTVKDLNLSHHNYYGLYFFNTTNSRIENITSNSNNYFGIYLSSSSNNLLQNITTNSNNYDGIYLSSSSNNSLQNINANMNSNSLGIGLYDSSNNTLQNITTNSNWNGILLSSSNNSLQNITTNLNTNYGILLPGSNNFLQNITANSNNDFGIYLSSGSNNSFQNIILNSNSVYGIFLWSDSDYNTINDSYIENNSQYGIYFLHSGSDYPEYNLFYNNIINNTVNYYNSTNLTNYFNTTLNCSSGQNIIGGSCIGGNFWAYPNGTGFSDTCTDADSDGICDSNYSLDGVNFDYLPLTYCTESWTYSAWSTCTGGRQTRTAIDANNCETTNDRLVLSQACTSEPGGGGGIIEGQPTETHIWTTITADEPVTMTVTNPEIHLTEITITTTETVTDVSLTVTEIDVTPQSDIQISAGGTNYQGFKIDTSGINDTNIANVIIDFKVNKTWLEENNLTYDAVTLLRKPGIANIWDALNTSLVTEDLEYYYFSAISPGFSSFVIFIGTIACNPGDIRCFNNELQLCLGDYTWIVTEKCKSGCEDNKCIKGSKIIDISISSLGIYAIVIVLSAGILVFLYFVFRFLSKKHAQSVWKESGKTQIQKKI